MKNIKDMIEYQDPIVKQLTDRFLNNELSWDEFYDLARARLDDIGMDRDVIKDYDRAMKGI